MVVLESFGFKNGAPRDADIVMDVRFLANPHWSPELRPLTGKIRAVAEYVEADPAFKPFFDTWSALLCSLLPAYAREGKSYLVVAVGCTGGRHRSVAVIEKLAELFMRRGRHVSVRHRDLDRKRSQTGSAA